MVKRKPQAHCNRVCGRFFVKLRNSRKLNLYSLGCFEFSFCLFLEIIHQKRNLGHLIGLREKNMKKKIKMFALIVAVIVSLTSITIGFVMCNRKSDNSNEIKSECYENSDIQLTIDQKDFTTTESLQTITGSFESTSEVKNIEYTVEVMTYSSKGESLEVDETGKAEIVGDKWSIKDLRLVPDNNRITITLNTIDGKSECKVINITYDRGYEYDYKDSDLKYDSKRDIYFVDNLILITFENNISESRKMEIVESIDGKVVGRINSLDYFQVKINKVFSLDELENLCKKVAQISEVSDVNYERIFINNLENQSYSPNDKWDGSQDWNENNPKGANWWCEAIKLPSAWEYNDRFLRIKIGIADSGFDLKHEDLNIFSPSSKEEKRNTKTKNGHGTHVAGIIGATANNNIGITGIVWNKKLLGYDLTPSKSMVEWINEFIDKGILRKDDKFYRTQILNSISTLVESDVKVINYSQGLSWVEHDDTAYECSKAMSKLLSKGYDFIVVQSAGNETITAEKNGFFCSINKDNCYSGKNSVSYDEIKNRIIVVANAEITDDGYQLHGGSDGSNYGNRVDIAAPGTNIYSTINNNEYDYYTGTSMAAPMVTGVAGLVWSVNPNFTGDKVKKIICDSTDRVARSNPKNTADMLNYRFLNAKLAVEKAISITDEKLYNECTLKFISSDTKKTMLSKGTLYKLIDENKDEYKEYKSFDYCDKFEIDLANGSYRVDVIPIDEEHEKTSATFHINDCGEYEHTISIDKKVTTTSKPVNSTTYVNKEYGWSVELPEEWNNYGLVVDNSVNPILLTGADTVNFCHKETYYSYGNGGIFSILACPLKDYNNISDSSFYTKITENKEYVYLCHEFDIQFDTPLSREKYDRLLNEYNILHKAKDSILESFKLLN